MCELPEVREGLLHFVPLEETEEDLLCLGCPGHGGFLFHSAGEIPIMMSGFNRGEDLIKMYI